MKIYGVLNKTSAFYPNKNIKKQKTNKNQIAYEKSSYFQAINPINCYYNIFFKGYTGDIQPAKKLFWILTGRNEIFKDEDTYDFMWRVETDTGEKTWSTIPPWELLKRTPEQAIQGICTLNSTYYIPNYILSPNYGDNWGRRANYIEINPRLIAKAEGTRKNEGLLNAIKILPAIPPSTKSIPHCIIISQLYPTYKQCHDGYTGSESLYCVDIYSGISKNLTSPYLERNGEKMKDCELVKAFNDLAHFRGFKTGIRMPLSSGQISVQGRDFNWQTEENAFIDACVDAIDLGFDCIFFDGGKHIGNYQMEYYCGVGDLPNYEQMQHITQQIRQRSKRFDIALIAEKANIDPRFENLGFTAGTDWGMADIPENLEYEYNKQLWNSNYAAGPCVSDDNDNGTMSYEQRLYRIRNIFNSYRNPERKAPVFIQMHDIFPLKEGITTHDTMMNSYNRSAFGDVESHYNNIFTQNEAARNYTMEVYREFEKIMNQ